MTFGFDKQHRLLGARDFKQVFDRAELKSSSRHLLLLACRTDLGHARLGLVIGKKHVSHAVERNRLKRLGREVFRLRQAELPAIDILMLARSGLGELNNVEVVALLNQQVDVLIKQSKNTPRRKHASDAPVDSAPGQA